MNYPRAEAGGIFFEGNKAGGKGNGGQDGLEWYHIFKPLIIEKCTMQRKSAIRINMVFGLQTSLLLLLCQEDNWSRNGEGKVRSQNQASFSCAVWTLFALNLGAKIASKILKSNAFLTLKHSKILRSFKLKIFSTRRVNHANNAEFIGLNVEYGRMSLLSIRRFCRPWTTSVSVQEGGMQKV
jgi:hypothetical protein